MAEGASHSGEPYAIDCGRYGKLEDGA